MFIPTNLSFTITIRSFSASLDAALSDSGVRILRTPVQAPTANAYCERLVGKIRRECLDYLIPVNERHLHLTLTEFAKVAARNRRADQDRALGGQHIEHDLTSKLGVASTVHFAHTAGANRR